MGHSQIALVCLLAPLAAFFIAFVVLRSSHSAARAVVLLSGAATMVGTVALLVMGSPAVPQTVWPWFTIGDTVIEFGFLLDGRARLMGSIVGVITFCIQVYAVGYMAHDRGRGRFFAFLALFEWAMLCFVFSPSLLQTFVFWELVGLASFLLIGFWYHKPSAIAAAKKAFLMTRIGDVGLFIGLILLFQFFGTLDILSVNHAFASKGLAATVPTGRIELIAGLLFLGIIGKSAQFPLHTWLPDAMEGPTPVSALLHSATMVAAGVFLFARFHELFSSAPMVMTGALAIATFTAVLASTMAMVAKDMKRVLAYSSISQLGFMLMGLAAGNLFAGMFHLTTHAIFKALLFLTAGAYIHHFGSNDMVAIGRAGGRSMRVTTLGLVVGGAALAGVPPLAGFFSKENVIGSLGGTGHTIFLVGAYVATFLTAYYTFRMIFLIVRPNKDSAAEVDEPAFSQPTHHEHHEGDAAAAPWSMRAPMLLLTAGAIVLGFLGDRLGGVLGFDHLHHPGISEMAPAIAVVASGICMAWLDFGRKAAAQTGFLSRVPSLRRLFEQGWYIDRIYKAVFVNGAKGVARFFYDVEINAIDGGSDRVGDATLVVADVAASGQTGRLQFYVGTAVVAVALIALYVGLR